MTRKEFKKVPSRKWDEEIGEFDGLVILPAEINYIQVLLYWFRHSLNKAFPQVFTKANIWDIDGFHESGYRLMDFIAYKGSKPICKLSGVSDVIHINGIGGYGKNWLYKYGTEPQNIPPIDWSIDCLPGSGLLRLHCHGTLTCGPALNSFEVFRGQNG